MHSLVLIKGNDLEAYRPLTVVRWCDATCILYAYNPDHNPPPLFFFFSYSFFFNSSPVSRPMGANASTYRRVRISLETAHSGKRVSPFHHPSICIIIMRRFCDDARTNVRLFLCNLHTHTHIHTGVRHARSTFSTFYVLKRPFFCGGSLAEWCTSKDIVFPSLPSGAHILR